MVKVGKLWGDAKFASLSPYSKLLYCYLLTQPSITTLGILVLDIERINLDLKLKGSDELHEAFAELKSKEYIDFFFSNETILTIHVINHFRSLPKSKSIIKKGIEEGKGAKGSLRAMLHNHFVAEDFKDTNFIPPTPKEVTDYAMGLGYQVNGKDFVSYYEDNDWYDKNNKKVRNWKAKVSKVWCREDKKLKTAEDAPKEFKYFFVDIEDGVRVFPESWKDGLPSHSNFIYAQYLIDEFNKRNS